MVPYCQANRRRAAGDTATQVEPGLALEFDFPDKVGNFDLAPFLSAASRHAYEDPDSMLRVSEDEELLRGPPLGPSSSSSRSGGTTQAGSTSRSRTRRARRTGRRPSGSCSGRRAAINLSASGRSSTASDATTRSSLLSGYSRRLPHATLFKALPLDDEYMALGSMDELSTSSTTSV